MVNFYEKANAIIILTLLTLISVGGAVSIVGAASHVTGHASKLTVKAESCPFVGCKCLGTYHYADYYWASIIKHENMVCFNNSCDAQAVGYRPCEHCHPPVS